MTDQELLTAAAKAAGLHIDRSPHNGGGAGNTGFNVMGDAMLDWHNGERWNPLRDDGDALRLAVKLRIDFNLDFDLGFTNQYVQASYGHHGYQENYTADPYAATRRAIVRAAAAIAK